MENKFFAFLLLFLSLGTGFSFAQEVTLEVVGNREIEPAYRINQQPKLIDTVIPYPQIQYPLLSLKYETSFDLDTIKAAKIKLIDNLTDLLPGYAKIGIGSKFMPLAEVYYGSTRSRKFIYDAHFKHLSSFGSLKAYAPAQFDRNLLNFSGKINEKKYSVDTKVHFQSLGLHQYGLEKPETPKDSIAQRYTGFGFQAMYLKHKKDSLSLNYAFGIGFDHYRDKKSKVDSLSDWFGRENNLRLIGKVWYKLGKEVINADLNVNYNGYKYGNQGDSLTAIDTALTFNNLQIQLAPNITTFAKNNRLKFKFGAIAALDVMDNLIQPKSKFYVYPDIEIKYSLFDDILIPYLVVNGGLKQNTLKSLSQQNEFILSNIQLESENNVINGKLGFKGSLSDKIMFNISAAFGIYKNRALFITDTLYARGNQFRVIYDQINEATITGSISYQMAESIKIEGIGMYHSYQCKNNIFAWNLPSLEIKARGLYTFSFPLTIKLEADLEGGRYGLVYDLKNSDLEENNQFANKLGFIVDLNVSAEYRYNKKLAAFVEFNNFAAQRYKRWYNYPVQGFQVLGGVSFRF